MKKNTGYREMLRDRCPLVVSHALKWCKSKEKWLDYVYKNQIWPLANKKDRLNQTKLILGIQNGRYNFDFHNTIDWKDLNQDETKHWMYVEAWVKFFMCKYADIEAVYKTSITNGKSIAECKLEMIKRFLITMCPNKDDSEEECNRKTKYVNDLADYLIDCIEGNI